MSTARPLPLHHPRRWGLPLPEGWAIDAPGAAHHGRPRRDRGYLLPPSGSPAGPKGSGCHRASQLCPISGILWAEPIPGWARAQDRRGGAERGGGLTVTLLYTRSVLRRAGAGRHLPPGTAGSVPALCGRQGAQGWKIGKVHRRPLRETRRPRRLPEDAGRGARPTPEGRRVVVVCAWLHPAWATPRGAGEQPRGARRWASPPTPARKGGEVSDLM